MEETVNLAIRTNGLYDGQKSNGTLSSEGQKDVFENGAVFMNSLTSIYTSAINDPNMRLDKIYLGRERIHTYYFAYCLRKGAAWIDDFDRIIGSA
jgi:hypothetical protein